MGMQSYLFFPDRCLQTSAPDVGSTKESHIGLRACWRILEGDLTHSLSSRAQNPPSPPSTWAGMQTCFLETQVSGARARVRVGRELGGGHAGRRWGRDSVSTCGFPVS